MTVAEYNQMIAFAILGVPLIVVFGGPYLWRFAVILGLLALIALHPLLGFTVVLIGAAWKPIKLFGEFLIGGYAAGLGFGRATRRETRRVAMPPRPRIQRFRRPPAGYYDFDDELP